MKIMVYISLKCTKCHLQDHFDITNKTWECPECRYSHSERGKLIRDESLEEMTSEFHKEILDKLAQMETTLNTLMLIVDEIKLNSE